MNEETLIAHRRAYNGIKNQDCAPKESISKDLLTACRHAYRKYQMLVIKLLIVVVGTCNLVIFKPNRTYLEKHSFSN